MKKLYLVRHAKSSWDDYTLADEKRPLSERGVRDAPVMARMLKDQVPGIQKLITSTAKRARQTASVFRKVLEMPKSDWVKTDSLYLASPYGIQELLAQLDDQLDTVAIFGHNPGFTDFVNRFSDKMIDNVPTCGLVRIDFNVESWTEIEPGSGKLVSFYYPKMIGLF
ncbi:MAG: histidine phosphatase family protein [Saprospiraceae bacterium]|nr:histidine phosphatase family protein [Saprospiraceae bacterium]